MKLLNRFSIILALAIACLEVNNAKAGNHGVFYRINRALKTCTVKGALARKTTLEWRINRLTHNNSLTTHSVIKGLEKRGTSLPEIKSYLAHLIDSIEWLNKKLKKLRKCLIDESKLIILKQALAEMNSKNFSL